MGHVGGQSVDSPNIIERQKVFNNSTASHGWRGANPSGPEDVFMKALRGLELRVA